MKLSLLLTGSAFSLSTLLVDTTADGLPIWLWRAFVTILIAGIIYLYKQTLDSAKAANEARDARIDNHDEKYTSLVKLTAAHNVMYEFWVEELASGGAHPEFGTRKTDQIHKLITQIAEAKKNG